MRVLFVNRMAAMVRGGGETFDLEMARHLDALGCQTEFLTGIPLSRGAAVPLEHPRVHYLRSPYTGGIRWDQFRLGWRIRIADFRIFEALAARWIKRRQAHYDLVQICEMPPLITELAKRRCRLPTVIRITAPDYHDADGAVLRASAVIASGTSLAMLRNGVRPDVHDIPNAVDLHHFAPRPSSLRTELGIPAGAVVCCHVARFQAVKNHAMLLEAFALACRARESLHLLLCGGGPLENDVRGHAARLKVTDRVHFLGEVPFSRIPDVYAASDLNLISSHHESFSFSALEGMAMGLPLITTRTEWVPGLIGETQGGCTVPVDDAPAFCGAILALADAPGTRQRLGAWNRARVERDFAWGTSAKKLLSVYQSVTSREAS